MRSYIICRRILLVAAIALMVSAQAARSAARPTQRAVALAQITPRFYLPTMVYQGPCFVQTSTYCLTEPPLDQLFSTVAPNAINSAGQIAGTGYVNFSPRAFLLRGGSVTKLGALGGSASLAWDLNDAGQVVGSAATGASDPQTGAVFHAFLWQNGVMTDLGTLGGPSSVAYAINGAGQVVGAADTTERHANGFFVRHAFLWQNGVMTDLGTLGGSESAARDINSAGQVVGNSDTGATDTSGAPVSRAFLWQQGAMTALAAFGDSSDLAYAINTSGQVVGIATLAGGSTHAVRWQNGAVIDLGVGEARGINNAGQVVGFCCATSSTVGSGVIWRNGEMAKLSQLIDPSIGWTITSANAINDAGQILGGGLVQSRAGVLLLTPKP